MIIKLVAENLEECQEFYWRLKEKGLDIVGRDFPWEKADALLFLPSALERPFALETCRRGFQGDIFVLLPSNAKEQELLRAYAKGASRVLRLDACDWDKKAEVIAAMLVPDALNIAIASSVMAEVAEICCRYVCLKRQARGIWGPDISDKGTAKRALEICQKFRYLL